VLGGWECDHVEPEFLHCTDCGEVIVHVQRLDEIGGDPEVVCVCDVLGAIAAAHDNDGDGFEVRIGFDLRKDCEAVLLGQVQVEQDEVRARRGEIVSLLMKEGHGLVAVLDDVDVIGDARVA